VEADTVASARRATVASAGGDCGAGLAACTPAVSAATTHAKPRSVRAMDVPECGRSPGNRIEHCARADLTPGLPAPNTKTSPCHAHARGHQGVRVANRRRANDDARPRQPAAAWPPHRRQPRCRGSRHTALDPSAIGRVPSGFPSGLCRKADIAS